MNEITGRITRWATNRQDIVGLLLVGSYARNAARPDSDIDIILLTTDQAQYSDNAWANEIVLGELIRTQSWGLSPNGAMPRPQAWKSRSASGLPTGPRRTPSILAHAASSPTAPAPCTTRQESSPP
ncbi:nucleotidyltransferase domain-containing protein [Streptomyces sp. NPDC059994]|uniref:nucleotidyltransferase domain-containing protein n=1 Tax=Streptomyces sp. NPDC059994 TaxID=3347029 RepID=UPI0036CEE57B